MGLGTQDSLAEAEAFVDDHGTTFQMLWDETFESWAAFGVRGQPAALLFAANGEPIEGWQGNFPPEQVLELARAA